MKKFLCVIALAAICVGSVNAAPFQTKKTKVKTDSTKMKEKVKPTKSKMKSKTDTSKVKTKVKPTETKTKTKTKM